MACNAGPDIIEDGLVLCLDAANINSYPKSGTTWTDLVGGNNGAMTNMSASNFSSDNGGILSFDGASDYINFGDILDSSVWTVGDFSVSAWVKSSGVNRQWILLKLGDSQHPTNDRQIDFSLDVFNSELRMRSSIYTQLDITEYRVWYSDDEVPNTIWVNPVFIYNSSASSNNRITMYLNSVQVSSTVQYTGGSSLSTIKDGDASLSIGAKVYQSQAVNYTAGHMSNISVYNRRLTSDEVRQNYEATVGRFT